MSPVAPHALRPQVGCVTAAAGVAELEGAELLGVDELLSSVEEEEPVSVRNPVVEGAVVEGAVVEGVSVESEGIAREGRESEGIESVGMVSEGIESEGIESVGIESPVLDAAAAGVFLTPTT